MKRGLGASAKRFGVVQACGLGIAVALSQDAAGEPASPTQMAAAARLEQAETIAELTRLRRDLSDCRAQVGAPTGTELRAAAASCPEPLPAPTGLAPLALVTVLGFVGGFVSGAWWLDWRQRRRHGGFRL